MDVDTVEWILLTFAIIAYPLKHFIYLLTTPSVSRALSVALYDTNEFGILLSYRVEVICDVKSKVNTQYTPYTNIQYYNSNFI